MVYGTESGLGVFDELEFVGVSRTEGATMKTLAVAAAFMGLVGAGVGGHFAGKEASKAPVVRETVSAPQQTEPEQPVRMPVSAMLQPGFNPCDSTQTSAVDIQLPGQGSYKWFDASGLEVGSHVSGAVRHRYWGWLTISSPDIYNFFASRGITPVLVPLGVYVVRVPCP